MLMESEEASLRGKAPSSGLGQSGSGASMGPASRTLPVGGEGALLAGEGLGRWAWEGLMCRSGLSGQENLRVERGGREAQE